MIDDEGVKYRDKKITGRRSIHGSSDFSDLDRFIMTKKQLKSLSPKKNISSNLDHSNKKESKQTKNRGDDINVDRNTVDEQDFRNEGLNSSDRGNYSEESDSVDDDDRDPHIPENSPKVTATSSIATKTKKKDNKEKKPVVKKSHNVTASPRDEAESSNMARNLIVAFVVFISFACFGVLTNEDSSENEVFNITRQLKYLSKSFPNQIDSTWLHLEVGINDVKEFSKPSVFMFVHAGAVEPALEIAKESARIASRYLSHNPNQEKKGPLILKLQDLKFADHGELISKYKKELESRHSMLVTDLESVSGNVAQGFRYFCDEYNPLVANAAIFLVVNLKKCKGVDLSEFHEGTELTAVVLAEKCLMNNWSDDLEPNIWQPLLARVVGVVLKIVPEN